MSPLSVRLPNGRDSAGLCVSRREGSFTYPIKGISLLHVKSRKNPSLQ